MKKKGLIISTVVMVMVLVAALSTATFAWFSSTAKVEVNNIAVNTVATAGLRIAVKTPDTTTYPSGFVSGDLTWDKNNPTTKGFGGTDAFGSYVDFTAVDLGSMSSATTKVATGNTGKIAAYLPTSYYRIDVNSAAFTFANFGVDTVYSILVSAAANVPAIKPIILDANKTEVAVLTSANGGTADVVDGKVADETKFNALKTALQTKVGAGDANKFAVYTQYKDTQMIIPTGYDKNTEPVAFRLAAENGDYMNLPIHVTPTATIYAIFCTIKLDLKLNKVPNAFNPGMAAASRIFITSDNGSALVEPFAASKLSDTTMTGYNAEEGTYKFMLAKSASATEAQIITGSLLKSNLQIWIEGTDGECKQVTAGSGFGLTVTFTHAADSADYATKIGTSGDYNGVTAGGLTKSFGTV